VSLPVVTEWMKTVRDSINTTIITKLFKCSTSNYLDGTEEDVLWDEQHDKSDTDSDEEGDEMHDGLMKQKHIQQNYLDEESEEDEVLDFE